MLAALVFPAAVVGSLAADLAVHLVPSSAQAEKKGNKSWLFHKNAVSG